MQLLISLSTIGKLSKGFFMKFKRIIIHWTAGKLTPNSIDLSHYHFLIPENSSVICGKFKPEDNFICKPNSYAAHTGGGNTASIGVALCGMLGFSSKSSAGNYLINYSQCISLFKLIATLSKKYNIPITPSSVLTHYEFGVKYPNSSSAGKIDIVFLPPFPHLAPDQIGDFIRAKPIEQLRFVND